MRSNNITWNVGSLGMLSRRHAYTRIHLWVITCPLTTTQLSLTKSFNPTCHALQYRPDLLKGIEYARDVRKCGAPGTQGVS